MVCEANRGGGRACHPIGRGNAADFFLRSGAIYARQSNEACGNQVIAQNDNVVAVNSALEIDITGQVCADSIGLKPYSGFGGQVDFVRGAARSKGGKPIIALHSTAKSGTVSRIVPTLKPGAGVVTSRADVHYVVTEHGIAYLHGKNLRHRAEALIQIADPKFRDELTRFAMENHILEPHCSLVG